MTLPKHKEPIEAFGPELMAALREGGRPGGRVVIKFDLPDGVGKKFAHTFQRRIHTLRQRMRDTHHEDYSVAMRAQVRLLWGHKAVKEAGAPESWLTDTAGKRGAVILVTPKDSEFNQFITFAGIDPPALQQVDVSTPSQPKPAEAARRAKADYDDLLDDLEQFSQEIDQ